MATYSYEDTFLRKKVDGSELEAIEASAMEEANRLGVIDPYYRERYVKARVYVEIAQRHIEAEGMKEKMEVYRSEMERYYRLAKTSSPSSIATIPIARG